MRDELFKLLANETDMVIKQGIQSLAGRRMAAQGMRTSKFCLHPAGDTPSACRLFDAIASICVPVVVSDDIELPFEDELDYTRFSIFVPLRKALKPDYLASMLRRINDKELQRYQQQLRKVPQLVTLTFLFLGLHNGACLRLVFRFQQLKRTDVNVSNIPL